jgi:hypothetical protein
MSFAWWSDVVSPEERIAALEVKVQTLASTLDKVDNTVTELRDLLIQARGFRWMLGILITITSFVMGFFAKYLTFR